MRIRDWFFPKAEKAETTEIALHKLAGLRGDINRLQLCVNVVYQRADEISDALATLPEIIKRFSESMDKLRHDEGVERSKSIEKWRGRYEETINNIVTAGAMRAMDSLDAGVKQQRKELQQTTQGLYQAFQPIASAVDKAHDETVALRAQIDLVANRVSDLASETRTAIGQHSEVMKSLSVALNALREHELSERGAAL